MGKTTEWLRRLLGAGNRVEQEPDPADSVVAACRAVARQLAERGIRHAIIGGFGLGAHGVVRATEDVDFLIDAAGEPDLHRAMTELGFETIARTDNLSTYLLKHIRIDFVHARRPYSQEMLRRAIRGTTFGVEVPTATAEDIIALKLQARRNDPSRVQDSADIARLVQYNIDNLDVEYLREFFRLFDCESELDDLLERQPTDS